jgi:hypothetical protein
MRPRPLTNSSSCSLHRCASRGSSEINEPLQFWFPPICRKFGRSPKLLTIAAIERASPADTILAARNSWQARLAQAPPFAVSLGKNWLQTRVPLFKDEPVLSPFPIPRRDLKRTGNHRNATSFQTVRCPVGRQDIMHGCGKQSGFLPHRGIGWHGAAVPFQLLQGKIKCCRYPKSQSPARL